MAARESKTYSIPVPAELDAQVRDDMTSSGFNSLSEYVRDAIRARLERSAQRRFEAQLVRAAERGEATDTSDVDIVVEFDPKSSLGVFEFVAIARYLQELIPRADVVERKALKPKIRERVLEEAVDAF